MPQKTTNEIEIGLLAAGWRPDSAGTGYSKSNRYHVKLPCFAQNNDRPWWTIQVLNRRGTVDYFMDMPLNLSDKAILKIIGVVAGEKGDDGDA